MNTKFISIFAVFILIAPPHFYSVYGKQMLAPPSNKALYSLLERELHQPLVESSHRRPAATVGRPQRLLTKLRLAASMIIFLALTRCDSVPQAPTIDPPDQDSSLVDHDQQQDSDDQDVGSGDDRTGVWIEGNMIMVDGNKYSIKGITWHPVDRGDDRLDGADYSGNYRADVRIRYQHDSCLLPNS